MTFTLNRLIILIMGASYQFLQLIVVASALSMPPQHKQEHTIATLPLMLTSWEKVDKMKDKMEMETRNGADVKEDIYDFIVAGAGTSGSILAARLSSDHFSVLLIEAGGLLHPSYDSSAIAMIMARHPETDWMYLSNDQNETCLLCPNRRYILSAGKGLGGSANLNYLDNMSTGTFQDHAEWVKITNDPSWGYQELQPYFQSVKEYMKKDDAYRSTYKALIRPNHKLKILKYAQVHKVLFDDNNRATGVEFEKDGIIRKAHASKEVLLSCGSYGSPKILMLSGIGSKENLVKFNISSRADLPVGKNLVDHLTVPLGPFYTNLKEATTKQTMKADTMRYEWNSTNILRMPMVNLKFNVYSKELSHFLGIQEDLLKDYMLASQKSLKLDESESMFINVALKKPTSRGEVTLAGNDPKLYPNIIPNYLSGHYDEPFPIGQVSEKRKLVQALEETVRLVESSANVKAAFTEASFPPCANYTFREYSYWDCYIKHFSMSFHHGAGTCSMGDPKSFPLNTVVDSQLKVVGIQGLRVIDASVMPTLVGTFPFQTVAAIAEKGADMIIKESREALQKVLQPGVDQIQSKVDAPYGGFRIKKLSDSIHTPRKTNSFSVSKLWQKTDQIYLAATHVVGSSLSEDDLAPPMEPPTRAPNPSYFPVRPLAGKLIFHPMIPKPEETPTSSFKSVIEGLVSIFDG